ncbi:MAG TPA: ABC transporter substrate-binding protein [Thermoanaerobaculia bacterium]|jgi:branched-chain amino acid transport system substrate-binding protein|nr:ABC transporter substrate-binding protein [Thermoanaerobaculia bacterium]
MKSRVLLAVLSAALLVPACRRGGGDEILVGEYGSLTGTTATFGQSTNNAIQMAFEQINAAGGVLGKKVRVVVEDDQSKPEEAATAVTKLINQNHVVAMLGEVSSSRSLAAAPICQANGVPMISPSSTNPRVTQVGDYIFRVCFIDPFQAEVGARIAWEILHLKKVAILSDVRNDYSVGLQTFFRQTFKGFGGEIVAEQSYSEGDSDFRAQLTQIKSANPEGIYVPGYYTEVGTIARQARELGITVPLIGGDGWDSPRLWEIGGEALNGCHFSNHYSVDDPSPAVQKFVADYKAKYNQVPDALAALGYDAARILADAMTRAGTTKGDKVRDALSATKDFAGVTGTITINKERNAVKPAVVLKIENGKFVYVTTVKPTGT